MDKQKIAAALQRPLPGRVAHMRMAPTPRPPGKIWEPPEGHREAAVLLLCYPHNSRDNREELHLVFIQRPEYEGVHSGQIAFPGGRREAGEPLLQTALREAREEIGLAAEAVEILGSLSPYYVSGSNHNVFPFVGYCPSRPVFSPCAIEVAEIIETPLASLLGEQAKREEYRTLGQYGRRRIPFFDLRGKKLWGATAMMISEFLALLEAEPREATLRPESPCSGVCQLDAEQGFCTGCARSAEEIAEWPFADDQRKQRIIDLAARRRVSHGSA